MILYIGMMVAVYTMAKLGLDAAIDLSWISTKTKSITQLVAAAFIAGMGISLVAEAVRIASQLESLNVL